MTGSNPAESDAATAAPPNANLGADLAPHMADNLADDLAYVRGLAEEGAHAPLVSGRYLLIWGGLMGAASLFVYFARSWLAGYGGTVYLSPWIIAGLLGWILSFTWGRQAGTKPGAKTLGNRTAFSVWFAVGLFMTAMFAGIFIAHDNYAAAGVPSWFMFSMLFPISFGAYGIAFYAMATAARMTWLKYVSGLSWVFAVASLFFLASPMQFLVGGFGVLICAAAPGVILMRREPSEIV